jgi:hypothetical protein
MHSHRSLLGLTVFCALVFACGHKNQYQMEKDWQEQQAKHLKPVELDKGGEQAWRRIQVLQVRVYSDAAFVKRVGGVKHYFEDWLGRANEILNPALQLRLEIEQFRDLPESAASSDLDAVLVKLRELDSADDVDLVVALIGVSPVMTMSFHDLGRADLLGKHIALRSMDDDAELRVLHESYDKLDATARSSLYAQRKRHKETAVLLHEIAHALGALHTRGPDDLMNPTYDAGMISFAAPNLDLMRYSLDERATDEDKRDPENLVKLLDNYLTQSKWDGWVAEERQSHLDALHETLVHHAAAHEAEAIAAAAQSQPAAPAVDLSPLAEADRATYLAIDEQRARGEWNEAFLAVTGLADRYPKFVTVQQKACELGMQFGVSLKRIKPYCDRMTSLLTQ